MSRPAPITAETRVAAVILGSRAHWLAAVALAFSLLGPACIALQSAAQAADGVRIIAPESVVAEAASQTALAIQVGPPESLPAQSFVRVRGLPATVSLTEGHAIAPGLWAVPLVALANLKAIVPAGVTGRTEVTITVVSVEGETLAEAKTALVIGPAAIIAPRERSSGPPLRSGSAVVVTTPPAAKPSREPPRPQQLSAEEKERAERLVANGDRHLEQGNIGAARLFFQRAAEAGLAKGALKMAATHDPAELQRLGVKVQGVVPDRNEARKWYERARTLGAPEAEGSLARLGGS